MATNRAVMLAMIQERDRKFLLHPGVTLEKFTSSLLHASASSPDILKVHLEKMATLEESQRLALLNEKYPSVSLPRYKFWDIPVPRIHSPTRQVCLRRPGRPASVQF